METANASKDLHEYFLGEVRSIGAVVQRACKKRVDRLVVARDQPGKCFFRACLEFRDQSGFVGLDRKRADEISHGEIRLQFSSPHITASEIHLASFHAATCCQICLPLSATRPTKFSGTASARVNEAKTNMPLRSSFLDTRPPPKCSRSGLLFDVDFGFWSG